MWVAQLALIAVIGVLLAATPSRALATAWLATVFDLMSMVGT